MDNFLNSVATDFKNVWNNTDFASGLSNTQFSSGAPGALGGKQSAQAASVGGGLGSEQAELPANRNINF